MSKTEKAAAWAEQIAADNSHGYGWGGWGPDYDCGHLVIQAFEQAGIPLKSAGASYTGDIRGPALRLGFTDVTADINLETGGGLRRGDILLNYANHAALCVGSGQIVQARSNLDGLPGDSSGREIQVQPYYIYPGGWDCVLRPPGSVTESTMDTPAAADKPATYTVKTGDTLWGIAKANGITLHELVIWNGITNPERIYPGDVLQLHAPVGSANTETPPEDEVPGGMSTYTVQRGDTLWGLAARFLGSGTRFPQLAKANGIRFPYNIKPGQLLVLPVEEE